MNTCTYTGYTLQTCGRVITNKRSRSCNHHDIIAKIETERARDHICIYNPTGRLSDFTCNRIPFGNCKICSRCREYHNVRLDKRQSTHENNHQRSRSRSPIRQRSSQIINIIEEQAKPDSVTQWNQVLEMEKFYVAEMTRCKQRLIDINNWKHLKLSELINDAPSPQANHQPNPQEQSQ